MKLKWLPLLAMSYFTLVTGLRFLRTGDFGYAMFAVFFAVLAVVAYKLGERHVSSRKR